MEMSEMEAGGCKPLTTFVHADTSTFREVVQRLTGGGGSNQTQTQTQTQHEKSIGAGAAGISSKRTTTSSSTSKLHERRQYMRPKLEIVKPATTSTSTTCHFKSSSPLVSPSTILSKLSIVEQENKGGGSPSAAANSTVRSYDNEDETNRNSHLEEEKAIQERRFYLHPSPRRGKSPKSPPELLTLFPLISPKSNLHNP
ncbi:hypothetical protein M0R45_005830 [Rubus argutus]|uniref:VQ domain-containing protein n=1 Tax=Rubus argutus TaxID=59490 RepID=A0AAW1YP34_RUBAR